MKFFVTFKSISALVLSRLTLIYITNGNIVSIIVIIRKSSLRSSTV